jgi:hypothetical protein
VFISTHWIRTSEVERDVEPLLALVHLDTLAGVVKLVYTQVLGTCAARREGSSPFSRTAAKPQKQ